jgi:hypothetical protein
MTSDRIKEIQETTAYPDSVSVKQALFQVWNECEQEKVKNCSMPTIDNSLLLDEANDIDTVGKCANCGVEFHVHKSGVYY